ncbi:unnamed protein product [Ilex paraguariensis]|uniref:Uncharacterized protein n=1 Tax=Ilex paraguariensis TaxID=185542 RepID=A0ABC8UHD1_9AQUA
MLKEAEKFGVCYLSRIPPHMDHKQKVQRESGATSELLDNQQAPKLICHFPQTRPVVGNAGDNKPRLSVDILAGVSVFVTYVLNFSFYYFRRYVHSVSMKCPYRYLEVFHDRRLVLGM